MMVNEDHVFGGEGELEGTQVMPVMCVTAPTFSVMNIGVGAQFDLGEL